MRIPAPSPCSKREIIRKEFAILEDGIDRVSQESRLAAQFPHTRAICGLKLPNFKVFFVSHVRSR